MGEIKLLAILHLMVLSKYVQGVLGHNCNMYLDKHPAGLENECRAQVSLMFIWQAIHKSGYSLKKACQDLPQQPELYTMENIQKIIFKSTL